MLEKLVDLIRSAVGAFNLVPQRRAPFLARRFPYSGGKQMRQALGPDLGAETTWTATDGPMPEGDLATTFASTDNVHKWLHYLPIYETTLSPFRDRPARMLEIGVFHGGSLQMWRRYLHPGTVIVGIDIDPSCKRFEDEAKNVHVRIGAQQNTAFLRSVIDEFGPFDIILDDGSHMASHMVESFRFLFPNALAPGGAYIVEDIHTNYWKGYRDTALTFVDFTRWLIDSMHAHYLQIGSEPELRIDSPTRRSELTVPVATVLVEKIELYDSIAVVHRAEGRRELPRSMYRGARLEKL